MGYFVGYNTLLFTTKLLSEIQTDDEKMNSESKRRKGLQLYYLDIETTGINSEENKIIRAWISMLIFGIQSQILSSSFHYTR